MQTQTLRKSTKPSWFYLDRASKIQFPSRHFAAKAILTLLGKCANDGGKSWPSYEALMAETGLRNRTSVSRAIQFLKTYGVEQIGIPLLTYKKGSGGEVRRTNNNYQLHLSALEALIKKQGVFDLTTGRRIGATQGGTSVESTEWTGLTDATSQSSPLNGLDSAQSSPLIAPVQSLDSDPNHHITTIESKSNPLPTREGGVFVFSESGSKPAVTQPPNNEVNEGILGTEVPRPAQPALPCNLVRDWTRPLMLSHAKNVVKMATAILEALAAHGDGTPEARIKTLVWREAIQFEPMAGGYPINEEQLFASVLHYLEKSDDIRVREECVHRLPYQPPAPRLTPAPKPSPPVIQPPSKKQAALAAQWEDLLQCQKLAKQWELEKRRHCTDCDEGVPAGDLSVEATMDFCCPVCGSSKTSSVEAWLNGLKQKYVRALEGVR